MEVAARTPSEEIEDGDWSIDDDEVVGHVDELEHDLLIEGVEYVVDSNV